jgi:hypothetical protein
MPSTARRCWTSSQRDQKRIQYQEIAETLVISERTVSTHVSTCMVHEKRNDDQSLLDKLVAILLKLFRLADCRSNRITGYNFEHLCRRHVMPCAIALHVKYALC